MSNGVYVPDKVAQSHEQLTVAMPAIARVKSKV
jgi:hypothetical protein